MVLEPYITNIKDFFNFTWQLYEQSGWLMVVLILLAITIYYKCFQLYYLFFKQVSLEHYKQAIETKDAIELEGYFDHWLNKSEAKLRSLFIMISICPLLGLLGTVMGMIDTFSALADVSANNNAISDGISVALNTTQAGLVIAVPALFFLAVLKQKKEKFAQQVNYTNKVNAITKSEEFV